MEAVKQALQPTGCEAMIVGDCGCGMVTLRLRDACFGTGAIEESVLRSLRVLPDLVVANGGYVMLEGGAPEIKMHLNAWSSRPSGFTLLKALKQRFDPENILCTGRLVGEL
jgi:hypothetical protein